MKYKLFKKKLQEYPYFTSAIFYSLAGKAEKTLYNQLDKWVKAGDVVKLRRGLFTLSDNERKVGLSKKLTANVLYPNSYISLEFALSYYGMIPEAVFTITSVSTQKTKKFTNAFGEFLYKNIKKNAFFGFQTVKDEFGVDCLIATPEKALLDHFYFNVPASLKIDGSFFEDSLRLQNTEQLDMKKMRSFAKKMNNQKSLKIVEQLTEWIKK